jgi:integrase
VSPPRIVFRSLLGPAISAFIAHKRALGRRYENEERTLRLFDRYLAAAGVGELAAISPALVEAFLASRPRSQPRSYNHLRGVLARLFAWLVEQQILAASPLRVGPRRVTTKRLPFLFSPAEAARLLAVAAGLPERSRAPLRGPTYELIFALLFGLGLRVGEVSRLSAADVDLERGLLVIRHTKFSKSRLVPFGPRLGARLAAYLARREERFGARPAEMPLFCFVGDLPINPGTISQTFHQVLPALELSLPAGVSPPRLHDLRHSFAVGRLLRWYEEGVEPGARLFALSTFMGHVNPTSTAEYLTITAELLRQANRRFEAYALPALAEPGS